MARATEKELSELHSALCKAIRRRMDEGETVVTKAGDIVKVDASPALLNVARQFLRDNKIEQNAVTHPETGEATPIGELLDDVDDWELPFDGPPN